MLMKDSSKTIAELSSLKSHSLLVCPFVREATARFYLLMRDTHTFVRDDRSLRTHMI